MWFIKQPDFITDEAYTALLANGHCTAGGESLDPLPVIKLFTPDANATWLLTEIDPDDPDLAFGLCDLGLGFPELGRVRLSELDALPGPFGLRVERDEHFRSDRALSAYVADAMTAGRVIA